MRESISAWEAWFTSWVAAHWMPADVAGLKIAIRLFDEVLRGSFHRSSESRYWCDAYGITPTGRLKLRWTEPKPEPVRATDEDHNPYAYLMVNDDPDLKPKSRYGHLLKVVDEQDER